MTSENLQGLKATLRNAGSDHDARMDALLERRAMVTGDEHHTAMIDTAISVEQANAAGGRRSRSFLEGLDERRRPPV